MPSLKLSSGWCYFRLEGHPKRPVLALLHPIGADHSLWDKVVPLLLPTHCVLRPDLRGHGGSATTPGDRTLSELAADFVELCDRLTIESVDLCGISLGGFVAAAVASLHPSRVRRLVLCSTALQLAPPPGGWDGRATAVRAQGMEFLAAGMVQRMVSAAHLERADPSVDTLRTVFVRTDPEGYAGACAVLRTADLRTLLPAVRASTLVLNGELDALVPRDIGAQALALLDRRGASRELPCGHFPPLEAPESFSDELLRWVA